MPIVFFFFCFFGHSDILMLKLNFCHCGFVWTPRDANRMAHQVTRWGLVVNLQRDWVVNVPSRLQDLLSQLVGCLGCVCLFLFCWAFPINENCIPDQKPKRTWVICPTCPRSKFHSIFTDTRYKINPCNPSQKQKRVKHLKILAVVISGVGE